MRLRHQLSNAIILLITLMPFALAAENVFRSGHLGAPDTLDPQRALTGPAMVIIMDLFEGLMTLDAVGKPIPGVISDYTVSEDGLVYTFELRKGLRWSDGHPLDATDFVYTFRRFLDPQTAASQLANYADIIMGGRAALFGESPPEDIGVEAIAAHTLRITLTRPAPYFMSLLALPALGPVPQHVIEQHGTSWTRDEHFVSNGAFKVTERAVQNYVKLIPNSYFHAAGSVRLGGVYYRVLDDLNTGLRLFRAGELDAMVNYPPEKFEWIRQNLPGALRLSPSMGLYVYRINHHREKFQDLRVRKALSIAIDRETISATLLKSGDPPAYGLVPPGITGYPGGLEDPVAGLDGGQRRALARSLLAEAGYGPGRPLELSLLFHTSEEHKRIAIAVAAMWRAIGVKAELVNAERQVVNAAHRNGDYDIVRQAWFSMVADPVGFLMYFEGDNWANTSGYHNNNFDDFWQNANQTLDLVRRFELLRAAERTAIEDYASIPIHYYVGRRLLSARVRGWRSDNMTAFHPSRYLWIEE